MEELLVSAGALLGMLVAIFIALQLAAPRSPRHWVEALRVLLLAGPLAIAGYALIEEVVSYRVRRALREATLVPAELAQAGSVAFLALIIAVLVRLRAPSAAPEERPNPRALHRLGWLSVAATLLSVLVILRTTEIFLSTRALASRWGLSPPGLSEPFGYVNLTIPVLVLGLATIVVVFRAKGRMPPRSARIVCGVAVCACLGPGLFGLGALLNTLRWVRYEAVVPPNFKGVIPGRGAEIGARVMEAIRESLRERQGEHVLPDGTRRRFFLYAGPGAPSPPEGPLEFAKLFKAPSCVLLPQGPPGNRKEALEPFAVQPRRQSEIYSPQDLAQGVDQFIGGGAHAFDYSRLSWSDQPYYALEDDYGYVFTMRRYRRRLPRRGKVFDDALYEIKVLVFRDFYHQKGKLQGPYFHSQFVVLERP